VKVFGEDGFGFIETPDGAEIYFHKNAVTRGGWDKLDLGTHVRFSEADGDKGPHATRVTPISDGDSMGDRVY
jgi:cold shock CspA family protein